jgi:hypothetical protein
MRGTSSTLRHSLRTSARLRVGVTTLIASSAVVSAMVLSTHSADAAPLTVTNCNSSGPGSLSSVVAGAASGSTVTFSVTCPSTSPISPNSTVNLTVPISINGPGPDSMVIDGFFDVNSNVSGVSLSGFDIEGGNAGIENDGTLRVSNCGIGGGYTGIDNSGTVTGTDCNIAGEQGIYNTSTGTVTLRECSVEGSFYGGLHNLGTASLTNCNLNDNQIEGANGAAIYNDGELTITSSTLTGNIAAGEFSDGGAVASEGGSVTITDSTISNNDVGCGTGAGIENDAGTMNVVDSTVSGNNDDGCGPGAGIYNTGTLSVTASTITSNKQGGIYNGGTASVAASILSGNGGGNCSGEVIDAGYNLDNDGSCGFSATNHSYSDVKSYLGGLRNNGGPTETQQPSLGTPVIDTIPIGTSANGITLCPSNDQRGVARPQGSACDIGAVELSATPTITSADGVTVTAGQTFSFTVTTSGGPAPPISEKGALPGKVRFVDDGNGTATISGKTKQVGSYVLLINAKFPPLVRQVFTLKVRAG